MWILLKSVIRGSLVGRGGCGPYGHKIKEHKNKGIRGRVSGGNRMAVVSRLWAVLSCGEKGSARSTRRGLWHGRDLSLSIAHHPCLSAHCIPPQNNGCWVIKWRFRMWFLCCYLCYCCLSRAYNLSVSMMFHWWCFQFLRWLNFSRRTVSHCRVGSSDSPLWLTNNGEVHHRKRTRSCQFLNLWTTQMIFEVSQK